ncbi:unnamed protein product [Mytilus coruscus]|uniref:Reverse transcriptase RNase H-like domain-containing protein n=1 Tax=Mytilus coruscus TaxID=42192 RepID=A0A6J8B0A6_MYTCO|nr:unnamed protein product [Mytilus coruscus]
MEHLPRSCAAYGKTYNQCKKPNHFKKICKSKIIHAIEEESDSGDDFYIECIENQKKSENSWMENSDLFEGIGELEGYHHIELDKSINPVIHPPRRVPIALQERLKSEIERMDKLGIVEKVEHPTEWVCSIVIVENADDLKTLITNSPVLRYFNSTKPVKLSVDASQNGLGAVLLQKELPVEYASKALTTSQKNWAKIEKELYAIVFRCERFHQYVYGRTIEVETDHKPLEVIFKKPLVNAPSRIQKLILRLQKYDINVVYKPGKLMYISDTLSRAYLNEFDNSCDKDIVAQVHLLVKHVSVSESKMDEFRKETDCDDTLTELKKTVKDGWPENKSEIIDKIKPYWDYREEIHESQG